MKRDAIRCRPSATQELLLQACLRDGEPALAAWSSWCARVDLDRIDEESFRHLPLAWQRLQGRAAPDRTLEIAKGTYRQSWYRNQLLLRALSGVFDTLADEGISAMLLKGATLATRYYPTPGARPMGDLDVLVPHAEAPRALSRLEREGWLCEKAAPPERLVGHAHGVRLVRDRVGLDLHWNALWAQRTPTADEPFWRHAVGIVHQGRRAYALSPTDELFHACMHGARRSQNAYSWAPTTILRWITDAFHVAAAAEIDWSRIDRLARRYHARLHLRDAFSYLRELGLAVPDALLAEWSRVRSASDRLHYELALAPRPPRVFRSLPRFRFWDSYRMKMYIEHGEERVEAMGVIGRAAGFPEYLVEFAKTDLDTTRLAEIPARIAGKLLDRPGLLRP